MPRRPDPFSIKEEGGDIRDRDVGGFSNRRVEGSTLGEPGLATLQRVISKQVPVILAICVTAGMLLVGWRLIYLQIYKGHFYRAIAEGNRIRSEIIPAK